MDTIKKQINFEVKQIGDVKDRVLRFIGSDETPDRDSDIIEVAGWKIDEYMKNPVFLWAHNSYSTPPIGKCLKVEKDLINKQLVFDIKFPTVDELTSDIDNPSEHAKFIDMIYNMYKNGYLNATSVGFRGIKFKTRDDEAVLEKPEWQRGRRYIEQNLLELSAVPVPANPNALQTAKSEGLISEIEIKSFFIDEENKGGIEPVDNTEITEKSGARLSKETVASLKAIKAELESKFDSHQTNHKESMKAYKSCMKKLNDFISEDEENEEPEENEDPEESPKSIEDIIEKAFGKYAERLEALINRRDPEKIEQPSKSEEINLDEIDFPITEKDAAKNELQFKPEDIAKIVSEVIEEKLNAITGKI